MVEYRGGGTPPGRYYRKPRGRLSLSFVLLVSFAILILGKVGHPVMERARLTISEILAPISQGMRAPFDWAGAASEWLGQVLDLYDENGRLRTENANLLKWQEVAGRLDIENRRLREALAAESVAVETLVTARVISVQGGPYVRSVLINQGQADGLQEGLAVITAGGVVGRIIIVGPTASRVLLLTDLNSRIPVAVERSGQNGIAIGQNSQFLGLGFLPVDMDIRVGDRVLTSGDGGIFPPDLPLGEVILIDGEKVSLRPLADLRRLDFVRVLDYDVQVLEPNPSSQSERPPEISPEPQPAPESQPAEDQ